MTWRCRLGWHRREAVLGAPCPDDRWAAAAERRTPRYYWLEQCADCDWVSGRKPLTCQPDDRVWATPRRAALQKFARDIARWAWVKERHDAADARSSRGGGIDAASTVAGRLQREREE